MLTNPDADGPPALLKLLEDSTDDRLAPATWIAAVSGGFLIALAIIMACNGLHRNRECDSTTYSKTLTHWRL